MVSTKNNEFVLKVKNRENQAVQSQDVDRRDTIIARLLLQNFRISLNHQLYRQ